MHHVCKVLYSELPKSTQETYNFLSTINITANGDE